MIRYLICRLMLFLATGLCIFTQRALPQNIKNILILHMESSRIPANRLASKTIEDVIAPQIPHQLYEEYLDENRLGTDYSGFADGLEKKYSKQKMDLVFTVGPQALWF